MSERWSGPLVVELDGPLNKADGLTEGIVTMLLRRPSDLPGVLAAVPAGSGAVAGLLARQGHLDAAILPLRKELVDYLQGERTAGREIHLVTSAPQSVADAVAARLGIFASARGAENGGALRGEARLRDLQRRFPAGFSYAGNGRDDLPAWRGARSIVVAGVPAAVERVAGQSGPPVEQMLPATRRSLRDWIRALRLHQWSKNLLLFVPLFLAHRYGDLVAFERGVVGFVAFGFVASGSYLLNDLSDLEADRAHPTKRFRLVARGDLGALPAFGLALALIAAGLVGGLALHPGFGGLLVLYLVLMLSYSLHFKRVPIFDAFVLGSLYTLRVIMGSVLVGVVNSPWLVSFTMFSFFSLSMAKRHLEIMRPVEKTRVGGRIAGRGYLESDAPLTLAFGVSSSLCAILILFFYVTNDAYSIKAYSHPHWLWLMGVWVFLWFARIWLLTHRGELNDDPVLFAVRDPWSYVLGLLVAATFVVAVL